MENSNAKNLLEMGVRELLRENDKDAIMAVVEGICNEKDSYYER